MLVQLAYLVIRCVDTDRLTLSLGWLCQIIMFVCLVGWFEALNSDWHLPIYRLIKSAVSV